MRKWMILLAAVALLAAALACGESTPEPAQVTEPAQAEEVEPTDAPAEPTEEPAAPTATSEPTDTPEPGTHISQIIHEELGECNREVPRVASVDVADDGWASATWAINDNLTMNLIKGGAKRDVYDTARALCNAGYCDGLRMTGTFAMQDAYGNVSEETVVDVVLRSETLKKINWDNVAFTNIYSIADAAKIHPEFQD